MTGPHCTKEMPVGKNTENKKPQLRKTRSQDLPDKHHPEHQKVLSETRLFTQEAFSKTSKVETITSKSTIERREEMHTSFSHSHTVNVSHSPTERDKRSHVLQQTKRDSQETPPPPPSRDPGVSRPSIKDIQRELQCAVQKTNSEDKCQACSRSHPFHSYSKVSLRLTQIHFPIVYSSR